MKPRTVAFLGALMMILGSLMTWAKVESSLGTIGFRGYEGNGRVSLVIGVVAVVAALAARTTPDRRGSVVAALCGLAVGALCARAFFTLNAAIDAVDLGSVVKATIGIGLYATTAGAALTFFGGLARN